MKLNSRFSYIKCLDDISTEFDLETCIDKIKESIEKIKKGKGKRLDSLPDFEVIIISFQKISSKISEINKLGKLKNYNFDDYIANAFKLIEILYDNVDELSALDYFSNNGYKSMMNEIMLEYKAFINRKKDIDKIIFPTESDIKKLVELWRKIQKVEESYIQESKREMDDLCNFINADDKVKKYSDIFTLQDHIEKIKSFDLQERTNIIPESQDPSVVKMSQETFENILLTCSNLSALMMRSASTLSQFLENDYSNLITIILNMKYYSSHASREVFNYNGKTDILIKINNYIHFVAEAKIWRNWNYIKKGIDTLLKRYSTQFETKMAFPIYIKSGESVNEVKNLMYSKIIENYSAKNIEFQNKTLMESDWAFQFEIQNPYRIDQNIILSFLIFDLGL